LRPPIRTGAFGVRKHQLTPATDHNRTKKSMRESAGISGVPRDPVQGTSRYPRTELAWFRRGQVFTNPVTGERIVALTYPETHPD
jgi:hypothetical protein